MANDTPQAKRWFSLIVDDKALGIFLEDSAAHKKAVKAYDGLKGIEVRPSSVGEMQKYKGTIEAEAERKRLNRAKAAARRANK